MSKIKRGGKWSTLFSEVIHQNRWFKIIHDKFRFPSGREGDYYFLATGGSVTIVPVLGDKIIFIKEFRYPSQRKLLELPTGKKEKGETPLFSAHKELREETGYQAEKIKKIGSYFVFAGLSSERSHVFLAEDLQFVGQKLESSEKEAGLEVVKIEIKKAYRMLDQGKFLSAQTIVPLCLAKKYLLPDYANSQRKLVK